MEVKKNTVSPNEYAVAKALNEQIAALIVMIVIADNAGLPENYEIKDLNRSYVLLADELQRLYDRNPELSSIEPKPVWKHFDVLAASTWDINEHFEDPNNNELQAHIARVDRLCIISGIENPDFSPEQTDLVNYAETVRRKYGKMLNEVNAENTLKKENDWHIPEYTLTYKYGSILINDVLKLKKTHDGSALDKLILLALKNPNTIFKPQLDGKRTLSTILSSAGITSTLRLLFFPEVGKSRGVLFRPTISSEAAREECIDTTELDLRLKDLGATTKPGNLF